MLDYFYGMDSMDCGSQKACKLLNELEKGLIERRRQGLGKPDLIYVKNFITHAKSHISNCENQNSGEVKITALESLKSQSNNTDQNKTEYNDTDLFPSFRENGTDRIFSSCL